MGKIEELRERTYMDLLRLLDEYGKGVLIRPTGFGKTGLLSRLIKSKRYSNILFLYPAEVVRDTVEDFIGVQENVTFVTYSKLINLSENEMREYGGVDLIVCDECHRLGADATRMAMHKLLKVFPDAHLVGATATPERMDLVDEVSEFFDNHVVYKYTLHDAFQDGVLQKPFYCFCSYGTEDLKDVETTVLKEINKNSDTRFIEYDKKLLHSRLIEISELQRMDKIIETTCNKYTSDTSYLKFIVFFSDFKHMASKGSTVRDWFEKAFPNHSIEVLKISSESSKYMSNVNKLSKLVRKQNHIDLVYCVDMLNMGYHVSDLTGIVMYRGTESGIVFSQQLGRVLNSGSKVSGIVFDVVDNIHREAMYGVLGRKSKETLKAKKRLNDLLLKRKSGVSLTDSEKSELKALKERFSSNRWWVSCNDLQPEDLVATGHEATYRELIAKTVAEPVSMRCRQAWKRWKERGGSDNPFTREHVLSQKSPDSVPLSPFCELKRVSVEAVLQEMGL